MGLVDEILSDDLGTDVTELQRRVQDLEDYVAKLKDLLVQRGLDALKVT